MHKLSELKDKLIYELEDYAEKSKFTRDDVEAIKYASSAVDHICSIMESMPEYSQSGYYPREGVSYAKRGTRRMSGGYSRASEDLVQELHELSKNVPDESIRRDLQDIIHRMERM